MSNYIKATFTEQEVQTIIKSLKSRADSLNGLVMSDDLPFPYNSQEIVELKKEINRCNSIVDELESQFA
jgi:uncharacterized protein YeeX (DUF496 family)